MFRAAAAAALRKPGQNKRRPTKADVDIGDKARNDLQKPNYPIIYGDFKRSQSVPFDPEKAFRVKFSKLNSRNEECVYYKDDEDRFTQQYTLKLQLDTKYKVSIEVEEDMEVAYIKLGGVLWKDFQVIPNPRKHSTKVDYTFLWCTDLMAQTTRKNRTQLPFVVKLRNHSEIEFVAMVKFYDEVNRNHSKGVPLSFLSLDDDPETGIWKLVKRGNRKIYKLKFN